MRWASIQSLSGKPMITEGITAMITFFHRVQVWDRSKRDFFGDQGLSLWKYKTTTAMMAPSWITTLNMSINFLGSLSLINSSTRTR